MSTSFAPRSGAAHLLPAARNLNDFGELSRAERLLLAACAEGGIARVGYRRPKAGSADNMLRGEFLAFLARGGDAGAPVAGGRVELLGAWVSGCLDLRGASVPVGLWLFRCGFETAPRLDRARCDADVDFADCGLPGLRAADCHIAGELALNSGTSVHGQVFLARALLGLGLRCERAQVGHVGLVQPALLADGARIGGRVVLGDGFVAHGAVRLVGARVDGDLRASGASLTGRVDADGERHGALVLDRIVVTGNVQLGVGFSAAGRVSLRRARIDGDLDASESSFDVLGDASWNRGAPLNLDHARVGGALKLCRLEAPLAGASLRHARVGQLVDDATTWGDGQLLEGFRYARLGAGAPLDARFREAWLARQPKPHLHDEFLQQPWCQAIKVLRRMGRDDSAAAVAMAREARLRQIGRIGATAPGALRWLPRLLHRLYGVFAGYGHQPWRLALALLVLWLGGAAAYGVAADAGLLAQGEAFSPLLFSLGQMLPALELQQQAWSPPAAAPAELPWRVALQWLMAAQAVSGWLACLALIATLSGWTERQRCR
jgi:hypothetical protein